MGAKQRDAAGKKGMGGSENGKSAARNRGILASAQGFTNCEAAAGGFVEFTDGKCASACAEIRTRVRLNSGIPHAAACGRPEKSREIKAAPFGTARANKSASPRQCGPQKNLEEIP
jgi:hypothetical protein